jgi:hypothetical protein
MNKSSEGKGIKMTLKNKLYNFFYGIKPIRRKGCFNVGVVGRTKKDRYPLICKYNWSIEKFTFITKKIKL